MLLLKALRNRAVTRLWLGQMGSAIGDEIYRMAFVWLSVDFIGADTGYISALQLLAVLGFGIFGAKWADRWSPYRTMIGVDLLRALITLTPVVLYYLHSKSFVALVISTLLLSGLGAFFEPAMQTVLPIVAKDPQTLKAANGLMSLTLRFARVAGPAIIGILSVFMATIHFFTLNALSYLFSTSSVFSIRKSIPEIQSPIKYEHEHVLSSFLESLKLARRKPNIFHTILAKTSTGGAWGLVYGLCLALLVHEMDPKNVKAFGLVMGSYGFGNVLAALFFANFERKNPERLVFVGLTWLGVFFSILSIPMSFPLFLVFTALSAVGGPLNDTPFTDLIQIEYKLSELPKMFRLRMILETFFTLIFMAISPLIFRFVPVRGVILACGLFIFMIGVSGLKKSAPPKIAAT